MAWIRGRKMTEKAQRRWADNSPEQQRAQVPLPSSLPRMKPSYKPREKTQMVSQVGLFLDAENVG